jgi:WD40 repeat protein
MLVGLGLVASINAQPPTDKPVDLLGDVLPGGAVARLGTLRFKHQPAANALISTVVFSPDGKLVVSLSGSRSIRLWDAVTGREVPGQWGPGSPGCSAIAFAPQGGLLAAALQRPNATGKIVIWDIATGMTVHTLDGPPEMVQAMVFADNNKTLILAGNGVVRWRDIATGNEQRVWRAFPDDKKPAKSDKRVPQTGVDHCLLSPDGKFFTMQTGSGNSPGYTFDVDGQVGSQFIGDAGASRDTEAVGFDLTTGKVTWRAKDNQAGPARERRFAFSADGKRLAVADGADQVSLRDTANGKLMAAAKLPAGKAVVRNEYAAAAEARLLARIRSVEGDYYALQANRNGTLAVSCDGTTAICASDGRVLLWNKEDPNNFRAVVALNASTTAPAASAVAFSPDGKKLAVGAASTLRVYNVDTLEETVPLAGLDRAVDFVDFSVDGKRLIAGNANMFMDFASAMAWDTSTWQPASLGTNRLTGSLEGVTFSPDRTRYIAVGADNRPGLYDLASGKLLAALSMPANQNARVQSYFSPDGKYVVVPVAEPPGTGSQRLYSASSGKLLGSVPYPAAPVEPLRPLAFSADGRLVASFTRQDGSIHIYDIAGGKLSHTLGNGVQTPGRIFPNNLSFSADGKLLASWHAGDNVVRVWDMVSGKQKYVLPPDGENHNRLLLAWSPDGRMLAVGDRKIRIWELSTLKLRRDITGHEGDIRSMAFSPDGRFLASGSADTTVLVWDTWAR